MDKDARRKKFCEEHPGHYSVPTDQDDPRRKKKKVIGNRRWRHLLKEERTWLLQNKYAENTKIHNRLFPSVLSDGNDLSVRRKRTPASGDCETQGTLS